MSKDIWDRKPKHKVGIDASDFTYKYYSGVEVDVWLKELKAEYDAIDKLNAMLWEKAEKYDELVKTEPSEALLARMDGCREAEDKLEAVTKIVERWDSGDFPYQNDEYSDASQNASSLAMGHIQNKLLGDSDV